MIALGGGLGLQVPRPRRDDQPRRGTASPGPGFLVSLVQFGL